MAVISSIKKFRAKQRDQRLLSELQQRYVMAAEAKKNFDLETKLNLSYLMDRQWLELTRAGQLVDLRAVDPAWRVRHSSNKIKAYYERVMGSLMRFPLTPEAQHEDKDQESRMAAVAADHLAKALWQRHGPHASIKRVLPQFFSWLLVSGSSYLAWWYDDEAEVESPEGMVEGDVRFGVPDPRTVFPDPSATEWDDMQWCFRETIMPASVARMRWPDAADLIEDMVIQPESSLPSNAVMGGTPPNVFKTVPMPGMNIIREYFERPSREFYKGRYIITANANGVVVHDSEAEGLPYGDIPMRKADFSVIPGAFYGRALISDLRGPQKFRNELQSKALEHIRMMMWAKLMLPVECELEEQPVKWTTLHGEVVRYSESMPGVRPWVFQPGALPNHYNQEIIRLDFDMQEIASVHTSNVPMRGQPRRTALEARLQQEQDDMARIMLYEGVNIVLSDVLTGAIKLCRDRWDKKRIVRVGAGDEATVMALSKADLDGGFQITVRIDPSLPFSRSERLELAFSLYDRGVFGEQGSPQATREFLRFADIEWRAGAVRNDDLDREKARFENELLKRGTWCEPGKYDNDEAHLEEHAAFAKRWTLEPDPDWDSIRLHEDHMLLHEKRMAEKAPPLPSTLGQPPVPGPVPPPPLMEPGSMAPLPEGGGGGAP